jgi:hypothetical protein
MNLKKPAATMDPRIGPSQYIQWYEVNCRSTTAGPNERAGFRDPPVKYTPDNSVTNSARPIPGR